MEIPSEHRSTYIVMIDDILAHSDLRVVSKKEVRKQMQERLGYDISSQRVAIKALIGKRFDKINQNATESPEPLAQTNGHSNGAVKVKESNSSASSPNSSTPITPEDDDSDVDISPPKKKQRKAYPDSDAKLAAMLQAEENSRSRSTRGGTTKKSTAIRKKATPKKKSATKIKTSDDSDVDLNSDGEKKEVVRKGGFHKEYALSHPLAELVGESQLSRPQVVKKIWKHIKAHDLQDPTDKRQILCDEKMQMVFKTDKVHMFTMNKLLGKQLYPIEEAADV